MINNFLFFVLLLGIFEKIFDFKIFGDTLRLFVRGFFSLLAKYEVFVLLRTVRLELVGLL